MAGDLLRADEPRISVDLATMTTAEGVKHWRAEVSIDGEMHDASDWTRHVGQAVTAQRDLRESALSDWAYREARYEARELFARAS